MGLPAVSVRAALLPAPKPARVRPTRRRELRLRCEADGRVWYPYVADVTAGGLEIHHHSSGEHLPVSWRLLVEHGARVYGITPQAFIDLLGEILAEGVTAREGSDSSPKGDSDVPSRAADLADPDSQK